MRMLVAIDLLCGRGGWTNALLEAGFEVYGFDIHPQPEYRGIFQLRDVLDLRADCLRKLNPSFAVCSSPCEQFALHGMKHFHPSPKYPADGIRLFEYARALLEELRIPYVMENVRSAQLFVGRAVNHCGPFYLWGNGVPAIFPPEAYRVRKGIDIGASKALRIMNAEEKRVYRKQFKILQEWSSSDERREDTARAATIPLPLARAVAEAAQSLVCEATR